MAPIDRPASIHGFYRPFYETGKGHIYGLATPHDDMRDGLAITLIARLFELPRYEGIIVEPSRPTLEPSPNVILVGSAFLFLDAKAHPISGTPPLSIGEQKLGERLRRIDEESCFRFTGKEHRVLVNSVTGEVYAPTEDAGSDLQVDYGVIRRFFPGPFQNTVILEGTHRLGTFGATMVATSKDYLDAIWDALSRIDDFDGDKLVEILVRATFKPELHHGILALETIGATPLAIVCNRQLAYDLLDGHRWIDQLPWDIHLIARHDAEPEVVDRRARPLPVPRLEVQADLGAMSPELRRLCRRLFPGGDGETGRHGSRRDGVSRLVNHLTSKPELFRFELVDGDDRSTEMPKKGHSSIRWVRKQFMVNLSVNRMLCRGLQCDDKSVRKLFPKFKLGPSAKPLASQFSATVRGKIGDSFGPLFGSHAKSKNYMEIDFERKSKIYELRLDNAALVFKLRL